MSKLVALIILDGFALRDETYGNAVAQANKPNFDKLWQEYPHHTLSVSGRAVGLPDGQMGNSEVGHLNIGAGRIVYQSLTRINNAIADRTFFQNKALVQAMQHAKGTNSAVHLFGLLSDGGVHSHMDHLFALLEMAKENQLEKVYVHAFLDGRDVGPKTAIPYLQATEKKMSDLGVGEIATVSGRYYAMDRDQRWERVKLAYDTIKDGKGALFGSAEQAVTSAYEGGLSDEFILPSAIAGKDGLPLAKINNNDAIIFYNFRPDRAIQLSQSFTDQTFDHFDRGNPPLTGIHFVQMTPYSEAVTGTVAFHKEDLKNTIGETVSNHGLNQLRIAETEKYPHVTYFVSGGREDEFPGEKRILIDSPKVATYDLKPEMSAPQVTEALLQELERDDLHVVILNFANPDMVGHSGRLKPTIQAIEVVDECLGKIVDKIHSRGGTAIITADHGNADEVISINKEPMTAHTTNPVPVIITKKGITIRDGGILADLAPTMLDLLNISQPVEMTGKSLIK